MDFSKRVSRIEPSKTLQVLSKVKEYKQRGFDVVDLGAGEPDFETPRHIREACKLSLDRGFTKYAPTGGILELKKAVIETYEKEFGVSFDLDEIIITIGGKQGISSCIMALVNEGDSVLLPTPYWVSYLQVIKMEGGKTIPINLSIDGNFKLTLEDVRENYIKGTKLLIINSPNNPTGSVYDREELKKIVKFCVKNGMAIISDECYYKLVYPPETPFSLASMGRKYLSNLIIAGSLSKTFCMTGWRVGYVISNRELIKQLKKIESHTTSGPTTFCQYAAVEAFKGPQDYLRSMVEAYRERRDFVLSELEKIDNLKTYVPEGAFYVFPDIGWYIERGYWRDCEDFARDLIEKYYVGITPGSAFGAKNHIRISYATSMEKLKEGLRRIRNLILTKMEEGLDENRE